MAFIFSVVTLNIAHISHHSSGYYLFIGKIRFQSIQTNILFHFIFSSTKKRANCDHHYREPSETKMLPCHSFYHILATAFAISCATQLSKFGQREKKKLTARSTYLMTICFFTQMHERTCSRAHFRIYTLYYS